MIGKVEPFRDRGRFYNAERQPAESILFGTLPSFVRSLWHRRNLKNPQDIHAWIEREPSVQTRSRDLRITWLGHATFLIQVNNVNIITDPVLGEISLLFPRILPLGITREALPPIDVVLLSHNHRDHMDTPSLRYLQMRNPKLEVLVGHGDKKWLNRREFAFVSEHVWWQDRHVSIESDDVKCTFLPAWHWSQRGVFDKNKSLWGSWMIQGNGQTVYFAGDTAYSPHFTAIAHHFPQIQVACVPIGPCEPHDWMKHTHLNAHQAVQAFIDLKADHFIPMHWGAFGFGHDHFELPIERLKTAWQEHETGVIGKNLHLIRAGQQLVPISAT